MACYRNTTHTDSHIRVNPSQFLVLFSMRVYMRGRSVKQHIPAAVQPVVEIQQYRFTLLRHYRSPWLQCEFVALYFYFVSE